MSARDDASRAIALILRIRDEKELAGRPVGDLVTITRQANDSHINDLGVVGKIIRRLAERS